MSTQRRLLESGSEFERFLLAAGATDVPDATRVREAAKVLGLVPRVMLAAVAVSLAIRAMKVSSWMFWAAAPAAAIAGIAGAVLVARARHPPDMSEIAPSALTVPAATVAAPPSEPVASSVVPAEPERERVTAPVSAPVAARAARPARDLTSADTLSEQARIIDRARSLVGSGDGRGALAAVDEYDARFGGGPLTEEAAVLRIEALARLGDKKTALRLAQRFLKARPTSVHAERVRALEHDLEP